MLRKLALKTGIGYTTLYRHLRVLVVKGLVTFHKQGEMKLMSNRLIKFNKHKTLYVGREFNSFKDIKFILKNIPFLSCLKRQQRFILKREHYALINHRMQKGYTNGISRADRRYVMKENNKGGSFDVNKNICCGLVRIKKLTKVKSNTTACKAKKKLKEFGLIDYVNEVYVFKKGVYESHFKNSIKYGEEKSEFIGCFYMKGKVYAHSPSKFKLKY